MRCAALPGRSYCGLQRSCPCGTGVGYLLLQRLHTRSARCQDGSAAVQEPMQACNAIACNSTQAAQAHAEGLGTHWHNRCPGMLKSMRTHRVVTLVPEKQNVSAYTHALTSVLAGASWQERPQRFGCGYQDAHTRVAMDSHQMRAVRAPMARAHTSPRVEEELRQFSNHNVKYPGYSKQV